MKAFVDTSSLIKKYVQEKGSDQFEEQLERVGEIIVAPIYWIELNSAIERRVKEKTLSVHDASVIRREAKKDLHFFSKVIWNDVLEQKAVEMIEKHRVKTLDSLQLASGILSRADLFLTSDQDLYKTAAQEIKNTKFI